MRKKLMGVMVALLSLLALAGCSGANNRVEKQASYEQISAEEAKNIMDSENGYILIDARTQEEYDAGHISGAILIPEYEIKDKAEEVLEDKEQLIFVYCRSGRRSKIASQDLAELGYTNVKEFGGIIDWEYELVQ